MIALWHIIPGPIRRAMAWALGGLLALAAIWGAAKKDARQKAALRAARADREAHERMNNADLGIGATDGERRDLLRAFAAKHGDGSAQATGSDVRGGIGGR
jgi:hypothetical protein